MGGWHLWLKVGIDCLFRVDGRWRIEAEGKGTLEGRRKREGGRRSSTCKLPFPISHSP